MITKTVKEYGTKSKRMRIDINKSDNLTDGMEVALIPMEEYNQIKQDILDLQNELMTARNEAEMMEEVNAKLEDQITELRNRKINLDKMIKNAVTPIDNHYQKEITKKDEQIKRLDLQYKALYRRTNKYNLELMGLNGLDILLGRYKKLIKNFDEEIAVLEEDDPKIIDADAKAIPGSDDQEQWPHTKNNIILKLV